MRKLPFLLAALAVSAPAFAADMATKMPVKAPQPPAPVDSWTGFYIGGNVGAGWTDPSAMESDTIESGLTPGNNFLVPVQIPGHSNSVVGGAQIGYNWQFAPTWVAGVEADFDFAHLSKSNAVGPLVANPGLGPLGAFPGTQASAQTTVTDPWSIRGRLGYVLQPMWMVYATGGFAEANVKLNGNLICPSGVCTSLAAQAPATISAVRSGWVVGGGVEFKQPGSPWIVGLEYLYYGFDGNNTVSGAFVPASGGGTCGPGQACIHYSVGDVNVQTVRLRLSYKFN